MKLTLAQIPPEGCDIAFELAEGALNQAADGLVGNDVVRVSGRAEHEADGLRVHGRIESALTLECSRCLKRFPLPLDSRYDVIFSARVADEDEVELTEADLAVCHLEGDGIDLQVLVSEQVLLEVPMAPLCKEACKGLCRHCGADLNPGPCSCNEPVDPRFAALKKLL